MVRLAVVGLGKMGMSHHAMINAHPDVKVAAVCDSTQYVLDILSKYTGVKTYSDYDRMLNEVELDAVLIATPSRSHESMVNAALNKGLHVFCEKPFVLNATEGVKLAELATERKLVNQVGYHYRFVGAFQEMKRLIELKAIGEVTHCLAEAYGPVVLRSKGSTWRNKRSEGGGCLYDYAAHPLNLLNWFFGAPQSVGGTALNKIFSNETEDEVYGTLFYPGGQSAQLSVNWSDESYRKMSTKITIWGKAGRMVADRQEIQVYFRDSAAIPSQYKAGWNVRYTTELTQPVWFYVRGEEYSAQLDYFVRCIKSGQSDNVNSFASAVMTDSVITMLINDANSPNRIDRVANVAAGATKPKAPWYSFASRKAAGL